MNAISKRLLSWLCVIALVLSFAPAVDLSGFAVETKAAALPEAVQTAIKNAADIQAAAIALDPTTATSCPMCDTKEGITWTALPGNGVLMKNVHYYVPAGCTSTGTNFMTTGSSSTLAAGDKVCILLNEDATVNGRINVTKNVTINIAGKGSITQSGIASSNHGIFQVSSAATINLYGGKFIGTQATSQYDVPAGSAVLAYGNFSLRVKNIVLNIFDGAEITQDTERDSGANIVAVSGVTVNMYGGKISGGKGYAYHYNSDTIPSDNENWTNAGGNIYLRHASTNFNMYGGEITGGTAGIGGNIYAFYSGAVNIVAGTVSDGTATGAGGNLNAYGTLANTAVTIGEGATISGGKAYGTTTADGGGNILYNNPAKDLVISGKILGGEADGFGGNIGLVGASKVVLDGAVVANGKTTSTERGDAWGGNIRAYNGKVEIKNGSLVYGGEGANANGINASNVGVLGEGSATPELIISDSIIVGGVNYSAGSNDFVGTKVVLSGTAKIVPSYEVPGVGTVTAQDGRGMNTREHNTDASQTFDISGLTEGAEIWMTEGKDTTFAKNVTNAQQLVKYFKHTDATLAVLATADSLYVGDKPEERPAKPDPVIGGQNITDEVWNAILDARDVQKAAKALDPETATTCPACDATDIEWVEATTVPGKVADENGRYHFYIDADTVVKKGYDWATVNGKNMTMCILLKNGATEKNIGGVMGARGGADGCTFNIMGEGLVVSDGSSTGTTHLGLIGVQGRNNTFNLYGGTFVYTENPVTNNAVDAAAVYVWGAGNQTVNMYEDVTIGPATQDKNTGMYNVRVDGYSTTKSFFNMYGGTIRNGVTGYDKVSGNVQLNARGVFNMYGGIIENGSYQQGPTNTRGGNIYGASGSNANIYGGTICNGDAKTGGGNIYVIESSGSDINIMGGTITGGEAANGGNFYSYIAADIGGYALIENGEATVGGNIYYYGANAGESTISGGEIRGGNAKDGGNIAVATGSAAQTGPKLTISGDAKIHSGEATRNGGNIHINYPTNVVQTGGKIYDGVCGSTGGGNVFVGQKATYDMEGGEIYNGENQDTTTLTNSNAGNVLIQGSYEIDNDAKITKAIPAYFNMSGNAKVYDGKSGYQAGNIRVFRAEMTMTDNAQVYGGEGAGGIMENIWVVDGNLTMDGNAKIISSTGTHSSAVMASAYEIGTNITLKGNASLLTEVAGYGVGQTSNGKHPTFTDDEGNPLPLKSTLTIADGWTGTAYILVSDVTMEPGQDIEAEYIRCGTVENPGTFTGKLYVGTKNIGALVHPVDSEKAGVLYLASAAVVDADGVATWGASNEAILDAYDINNGGYVILNGEVEIAEDIKVELNGAALKLTGSGKVYGMDSSNDDYNGYAKLTVEGEVEVQKEAFNGDKRYLALKDADGKWGFHRIEMILTHVTLRTTAAGLYYKSMIKSDDVLANRCLGYGVILSVNNMPGDDFLTETGDINEYTMIEGPYTTDENHQVTLNSGSLFNIIKEDADKAFNAEKAEMDVFANLYVAIDMEGNGDLNTVDYFLGDIENQGATDKGVRYSLLSVLEAINENDNWALYNGDQKALIKSTVETWLTWIDEEAQAKWTGLLTNILA